MDSPKIEYPCIWSFKIIGSDTAQITDTIVVMLEAFEYQFSESRHSRTGNTRRGISPFTSRAKKSGWPIFNGLKHIPSVKVIL